MEYTVLKKILKQGDNYHPDWLTFSAYTSESSEEALLKWWWMLQMLQIQDGGKSKVW